MPNLEACTFTFVLENDVENELVEAILISSFITKSRPVDAEMWAKKFEYLAGRFNMKLKVEIHQVEEPAGGGVGPTLEARDALQILEQKENRPLDLEKRALGLATSLLELCMQDLSHEQKKVVHEQYGSAENWAKQLLVSGAALEKMKEIIAAQKGDPDVRSTDLKGGKFAWNYEAPRSGTIKEVHNHNISLIAKLLGAPEYKRAGMDVFVKRGQKVKKGERVAIFYGETNKRVKEAIYSLELFPIFVIK